MHFYELHFTHTHTRRHTLSKRRGANFETKTRLKWKIPFKLMHETEKWKRSDFFEENATMTKSQITFAFFFDFTLLIKSTIIAIVGKIYHEKLLQIVEYYNYYLSLSDLPDWQTDMACGLITKTSSNNNSHNRHNANAFHLNLCQRDEHTKLMPKIIETM